MQKKKSYSEYTYKTKKLLTEWINLFLEETNPFYISKKGLCFDADIEDGSDNTYRYNNLDSSEKTAPRREMKNQIIRRVNLIFDIEFDSKEKISKNIMTLFLFIYLKIKRHENNIDILNMIKEKRYEYIPSEVKEAIIYYNKSNEELKGIISKYYKAPLGRGKHKYIPALYPQLYNSVKTRIEESLDNLFLEYNTLCDIQKGIISTCDDLMCKLTGEKAKSSTPDGLLRTHKELSINNSEIDEEYIKKLCYHNDKATRLSREVENSIKKIEGILRCEADAIEQLQKRMNLAVEKIEKILNDNSSAIEEFYETLDHEHSEDINTYFTCAIKQYVDEYDIFKDKHNSEEEKKTYKKYEDLILEEIK